MTLEFRLLVKSVLREVEPVKSNRSLFTVSAFIGLMSGFYYEFSFQNKKLLNSVKLALRRNYSSFLHVNLKIFLVESHIVGGKLIEPEQVDRKITYSNLFQRQN